MKKIRHKNTLIKQIQHTHGEELEEILRRLYVDEHRSQHDIARILSVSYPTVVRWLKLAGVRHRKIDLGD